MVQYRLKELTAEAVSLIWEKWTILGRNCRMAMRSDIYPLSSVKPASKDCAIPIRLWMFLTSVNAGKFLWSDSGDMFLHIWWACHTDEAALTWAYEGRETPAEQRIFGSLHRDVPFRISRTAADGSRPASTDELIRETRRRMRNGIAHSLYPYTLTAPYSKRWNYAVNVLRATDLDTLRQYLPRDMEIMPATSDAAYALLDVEISEQPQALALTFRYSATHYKQDTIRRFAALVRHHAEHILKTYNP